MFPVIIVRSRNSSWIVLTSETELSGPHSGAWAWPVYKLTSENGIWESLLKQGRRRSPNSSCIVKMWWIQRITINNWELEWDKDYTWGESWKLEIGRQSILWIWQRNMYTDKRDNFDSANWLIFGYNRSGMCSGAKFYQYSCYISTTTTSVLLLVLTNTRQSCS